MGFIEEGRFPFQEFSGPEIRAVEARLDAIEKKLDARTGRNQPQEAETPHRSELYTLVLERLARLGSKVQYVAQERRNAIVAKRVDLPEGVVQ